MTEDEVLDGVLDMMTLEEKVAMLCYLVNNGFIDKKTVMTMLKERLEKKDE